MAAVQKKLPLQSSTAFNSAAGGGAQAKPREGKTIEETYQKKTQLEHILLRPDTYVGSIEKHTQSLWVYESGEMIYRPVTYVPGLYKIFDEILVNAADNKQRDPSMDSVKVEIDPEKNSISVYNNGDGIPVEIHQEEGVYVPELIFGHLLTSSNYDDSMKKTTGGRNGYGAKLTNIFSTEFIIQTADGKRQKKYKQVFSENMGKKTDPSITKCKDGENWTRVTFKPDLAKFNMTDLEDDVVALMKKRVVDLAGTLGKTVKVELNGVKVPVKTFQDYVSLYLKSANKSRTEDLPRITEKVNDRWEVCVTVSDGHFQQVSFVNGIATIKGGTHVDYVTNQIANHLVTIVNKKSKNANIKAHAVRNHLWVFVNALIDNPAFDSQTKETLTTRQSSFGSKCELSPEFLKKVSKCGVVDTLQSWADFKQSKELAKTDGSKRQRINIAKLKDANEAGGRNSERCTLILTEGDSAKNLAEKGITVVDSEFYGVFPLRGKLLNVREASHKQLMENVEIQSIKQILGLQQSKEYDSVKSLRYGHLMIMTDQDHDGSHIKGLLINFFHTYWPSLLKIPSFLVEFITPVLKARHRKTKAILSFYSMPEYNAWKESIGADHKQYDIKYYKGLGTSTDAEGREYFRQIAKHKKDFVWENDQDGEAIELAFSRKKIEARKNWIRQFEPGTHLDQESQLVRYSDFVNKELILFSLADLQRSIPSMVDGLKPGQRKILFAALKSNLIKEIKIFQFAGLVAKKSAYHHGEQSLHSTIIGMAQNFVGSNNINMFEPCGQFGSRDQGGKNHASPRYISTHLAPLTRYLFPKEDDILLNYLDDDGVTVEPSWYLPIIPTVLINGSEGIGTGWSTFIPNYNPRDIVANVKRMLNDEPLQPMEPWYKGFKGVIERSSTKEQYIVSGILEEVDERTLTITELPIRRWTQDYKEYLISLATGKEPFIEDYKEHCHPVSVHFDIILTEENMRAAKQEGLMKKFKMTATISMNNMHMFDASGRLKKYDNPEQVLEEFFPLRLEYYGKRKKVTLDGLQLELLIVDNRVRFILAVVNGQIVVSNRRKADLFLQLKEEGYTPIPPKSSRKTKAAQKAKDTDSEASDEEEEEEENAEQEIAAGVKSNDYDYLISMPIGSLTIEKVEELLNRQNQIRDDVETLKKLTPEEMWSRDLDAFLLALDKQDQRDVEELEEAMREINAASGAKARRKKQPRKVVNPKKTKNAETINIEDEATNDITETGARAQVKPKGKGGRKKAAEKGKKQTSGVTDREDAEVMELKERLERYNIDSPTEQTAMQTEDQQRRRAPTGKRSNGDEDDEMEDDDDDDDDFEVDVAAKGAGKKRGGKKAAAKPAAAPKKRENANVGKKPLLSQKLVTDLLKPAGEKVANSPEKKVRKIRASPFNKKSGSLLSRAAENESGSSPDASVEKSSSAEVVAPRARPQRAKKAPAKYVVSDSDSEDDDELVDDSGTDSDFEEIDDDE